MSFWKKLKKIKGINVLKTAVGFIPGGGAIKQGIETFEQQIKKAKKEMKPKATAAVSSVKEETVAKQQNNMLIYALIGGVALYFLVLK